MVGPNSTKLWLRQTKYRFLGLKFDHESVTPHRSTPRRPAQTTDVTVSPDGGNAPRSTPDVNTRPSTRVRESGGSAAKRFQSLLPFGERPPPPTSSPAGSLLGPRPQTPRGLPACPGLPPPTPGCSALYEFNIHVSLSESISTQPHSGNSWPTLVGPAPPRRDPRRPLELAPGFRRRAVPRCAVAVAPLLGFSTAAPTQTSQVSY